MSLKEPKRNVAHPDGVQELLSRMFARDTGFSGPEILSFFSRYSFGIDSYPWSGGAPSRWQILEDCLAAFPLQQQKRIIEDLLEYDGPMKYGRPVAADVERIRQWLGETRPSTRSADRRAIPSASRWLRHRSKWPGGNTKCSRGCAWPWPSRGRSKPTTRSTRCACRWYAGPVHDRDSSGTERVRRG